MRAFLIQHIDALITTAAGLLLIAYSWRQRERLRTSPYKLTRVLPILALVVLAFGLLSFSLDYYPRYTWQPAFTSDGRASAEFPSPTTSGANNIRSPEGISIRGFAVKCNVPQKDINLILSASEILPESEGTSVEQRLEAIRLSLRQQGMKIVSDTSDAHGTIPGCRIVAEKSDGKVRCVVRLAITSNCIYRIVATATSGFHDDPVIGRFADSFTVQ
jgi:hypothetical protein